MSTVSLDQLFDYERLPRSGFPLIAVLLYLPVGFVLAFIRIFIGIHAFLVSRILPKAWYLRCLVLRVMCGVLGIIVIHDNSERRDQSAKVLVANYTTALDRVAMELVYPSVMPSMWDLPATLMWLFGYEDMGAKQGRETLVQNAKRHCRDSNYPILAFPEGTTTNGKAGLLKFSVWPFSLEERVQPVIIRISRPSFAALSPSVAGCLWTDMFWFLFVPYSIFHLRVLPVMAQLEDETMQEFAVRVQRAMADALSIDATPYTSADKIELMKRRETSGSVVQPRRQERRNNQLPKTSIPVNSEMELLVSQVKDVLPHVPVHVIRQDLGLTKDVDLTITNILEGRVNFTPEEPTVEAERVTSLAPSLCKSTVPKPEVVSSTVKHPVNSFASFGRTSAERHLTFAERKKALIEAARQRYLEKHGLSDVTSSSN